MIEDATGLVRLKQTDVRSAVEPLVRTFRQDPLWLRILPDESKRDKGNRAIFRFILTYGILCGEVYGTSLQMEGTAVWLPDKYETMDGRPALRAGALRIPFAIGIRAIGYMQTVGKMLKEMRLRHCTGSYWYTALVGIDPAHQGKGLGQKLLQPMLARCAREGVPVWLETETESNVRFYEHLGFEIAEETVIPGIDMRMWGMLKNPGKPATG